MSSIVPAIRPTPLRHNVAEVLRNLLLDGRFQPGEEVSDSALAAEFRISRGPVREALFVLTEEGLIVHTHNRGFQVPKLGIDDLRQIAQARLPLEILALELARTRATAADIEDMRQLWAQLLSQFRAGGTKVCARADYAFHARVWEMSGNPWLTAALRRICAPYFVYVSAFRLGRSDHSEELMTQMHMRYIDYLSGASSASADACVKFHLELGETPAKVETA